MSKLYEYGLDVLAPVLMRSTAQVSHLTDTDKDVLREKCEEDLHQFLKDAGDITERNKSYDTHDE